MRKLLLLIGCTLLFLVSCSNQLQNDIVQPEETEGETEISIIPNYSLSEEQYRIMLPYRPSEARGAITNQITNRLDIDELEEGLRRHSTDVFDPEQYVFEEGQYLNTNFIYRLIDELNPDVNDEGGTDEQIKAHRENPRVFSHILEQNYLEREENSVNLVGISIGIALKSVYRFQTEIGGPYYYEDISKEEMLTEGKKIAEAVLTELRQIDQLANIPIMIALFREEEQSSLVPGSFITKTVVAEDEQVIEEWENIKEQHILFPSSEAQEMNYEDSEKVKLFSERIAEYFPNFVGVVGDGFYIDENLTRLTIEIPIEFYGKGEVVGFTQYAYGLVKEIFPNYYDIEVNITSSYGAESLIYRQAGAEDPEVHIFH